MKKNQHNGEAIKEILNPSKKSNDLACNDYALFGLKMYI